ncbi:MAG: hypothetical protein QHH12_04595 [Candidatus Bathyarchaeota archaeon]|jgi:hypothetical protein|nr:hypothetical protein [Candidatus Bathyarchaeota archaeon A05DMB-3]MDH7607031.1 hypothetical protein [Candidatus Bathyarchaeota archaeon]
MVVKRKEMVAAVILGAVLISLIYYSSIANKPHESFYGEGSLLEWALMPKSYSGSVQSQLSQIITETIEGELEKGAFENVVNSLVALTEHKGGYVKSLRMTYVDGAWSGQLICKLLPENVTSFTFKVREIIDANGTVTYINISIEEVEEPQQQPQEPIHSTIYINLKEKKPQGGNVIPASLAPVVEILSKGLILIAQGVLIGVPICFASLGVVLLVNRGLLPIWKSLLKKPKVAAAASAE